MADRKNKIINLSPKMILTREGANVFKNSSKGLNRVSMVDGVKQYGLEMAQVAAPTLQNMVRIGYISQIQITRPEFTSVRSDLMDFSKLIFFGVLYRNFDSELFNILVSSPKIKEWNRHNPGNVIDRNTRIQDSFVEKFLAENRPQTEQMRKEIIEPVMAWINKQASMQTGEKVMAQLLLKRYLDCCRPFIWFVLCRFIGDSERGSLLKKVTDHLLIYVQKAQIADYLTLLLMEITVSAEALALLSDSEPGSLDVSSISEARRTKTMDSLSKQGKTLTVSWKLHNPNELSVGTQNRLRLVVYNNELGTQEFKGMVEDSIKSSQSVSLSDFYEKSSGGNAQMGLTYIGYLEEECRKVGMHIQSSVGQASDGNTTVMSLSIRL